MVSTTSLGIDWIRIDTLEMGEDGRTCLFTLKDLLERWVWITITSDDLKSAKYGEIFIETGQRQQKEVGREMMDLKEIWISL